MGGSPQPFLVPLDNINLENKKTIRIRHMKMSKRCRRLVMKRRSRRASGGGLEGSRRPRNEVERKVRTLQKLVPSSSDTMGLDGLFRETADYILALEMRVKVMKLVVKVLSSTGSGSDDDDDEE